MDEMKREDERMSLWMRSKEKMWNYYQNKKCGIFKGTNQSSKCGVFEGKMRIYICSCAHVYMRMYVYVHICVHVFVSVWDCVCERANMHLRVERGKVRIWARDVDADLDEVVCLCVLNFSISFP